MYDFIETVFHNACRLIVDYHILLPLANVIFYSVFIIFKIEFDYNMFLSNTSHDNKLQSKNSILFPVVEIIFIISYIYLLLYAAYNNNNIFIVILLSIFIFVLIFVTQFYIWMEKNPDLVNFFVDYYEKNISNNKK